MLPACSIIHAFPGGKDFFAGAILPCGRQSKNNYVPRSQRNIANNAILAHIRFILVLPTAKVLLYIALQLGPSHPQTIYATSNSESYVWTFQSGKNAGWTVEGKGFPASDFDRDPTLCTTFAGDAPPTDTVPAYIRSISRYSWTHNSAIVFDNGDRIEKHGDHAFLILNAGGPNQKIFTIVYPTCDGPRYCDTSYGK